MPKTKVEYGSPEWVKQKMSGAKTDSITKWMCSLSEEDQKKWKINEIIRTTFVRTIEKTIHDGTKSPRCISSQDARRLMKILDNVKAASKTLVFDYIARCTHDPEVILDFHTKYPDVLPEHDLLNYLNIKLLASIKSNSFVGADNVISNDEKLQKILKKAMKIEYLKGEISVQEVMGW